MVSSVRLPALRSGSGSGPSHHPQMPDACQPGSLCSWHRRANLPHRHPIPWPMMPVRCLLTRPRALRSAGIPASPLHTPSPVSLLLLPAFLISSLSSTNCRVPTRLHPSPRRGTQESLTPPPRPDPFRPRTRTVDCLSHLRLHLHSRPRPSVCSVAPPRPVTLCAD